jgi:F0F1-type ATP synthase membrane subunit c/vacuolar-type H+-ATPase subunit K
MWETGMKTQNILASGASPHAKNRLQHESQSVIFLFFAFIETTTLQVSFL